LAFTLGAASTQAAESPDAVIATMTQQVLAEASKRAGAGQYEPSALKALIESSVLPHLDFRSMTARTVGPKWREASEEQKQQLMAGFETLLLRTYAGAFSQAKGATFRIKSTRTIDDKAAEVRSEVEVADGREPVAISYRMELRNDGWKVTDVSVLGVWLVSTYRGQFVPIVNQSGIDGLIRSMAQRTSVAQQR
jgi:phospholipid transport system substrate-binding protein